MLCYFFKLTVIHFFKREIKRLEVIKSITIFKDRPCLGYCNLATA